MDRYERILALHRTLKQARYPVALSHLLDELDCSRATVYRDIAFLRDALGAPVENTTLDDDAAFAYRTDDGDRFELPGLWLSSEELSAMLVLNALLERSDPGVLAAALAPFKERMQQLLARGVEASSEEAMQRVRVIPYAPRRLDQKVFRVVAGAVIGQRRLQFRYRGRIANDDTQREVSPQRLTHYRDNWYLDAWDHKREGLRSFAVDRIREPKAVDGALTQLSKDELDAQLAAGYGIFSGAPRAWATLHFSAHAARWVADEHWHSQQQGKWLDNGRYELKVPYSNASELMQDILRYGGDVEVVGPVELREKIKIQINLARAVYH